MTKEEIKNKYKYHLEILVKKNDLSDCPPKQVRIEYKTDFKLGPIMGINDGTSLYNWTEWDRYFENHFIVEGKVTCQGCDCEVEGDELYNDYRHYNLCVDCNLNYDDISGYCPLACCLGQEGGCDGSC